LIIQRITGPPPTGMAIFSGYKRQNRDLSESDPGSVTVVILLDFGHGVQVGTGRNVRIGT
jgi:hypothetical protein